MAQALRAEFRKLLTVRSTYLLALLIVVLSVLFTYFGTSKEPVIADNNQQTSESSQAQNNKPPEIKYTNNLPPQEMKNNVFDTAMGAATLIAVVVILLMSHEYRYNTITYTLTLSKSRSRVLAAKILASAALVAALTVLAVLVTVATTYVAVSVKGLNLGHQEIDWLHTIVRALYYTLGFAMLGLAVATLVRNQVAAIVAIFLLPTLDSIISAILTHNQIEPAKYLPFSAIGRIGSDMGNGVSPTSLPSVEMAALIFGIYLMIVWLVSWFIFLRRDAT